MVDRASSVTGPVRTCVGCRQRAVAAELVRTVAVVSAGAPRVVVDHRSRHPGRGAWLHPDPQCVRMAVRRRAFGPALRQPGVVADANDLERQIVADDTPDPSLRHDQPTVTPRTPSDRREDQDR